MILDTIEYLNKIKTYLSDIINDHKTQWDWKIHSGNKVIDWKTQGEWKIQLSMTINFISSRESDEIRIMHTKSDNLHIMMGKGTNETIKEPFDSLLQRYQEGLEESLRGSEIVFNSIDLLEYKINKTSLKRGGSHVDSPKWLQNKKQQ